MYAGLGESVDFINLCLNLTYLKWWRIQLEHVEQVVLPGFSDHQVLCITLDLAITTIKPPKK